MRALLLSLLIALPGCTEHDAWALHGITAAAGSRNGGLRVDLTASSPYVTASRTGNTLYLQTSSSALAQSSSLSAQLVEDRGDGRGSGTWTFPSYANDIGTPFDHSTSPGGWSHFGTMTYTSAAGTGPDGSTAYDEYYDTSTTQRTQIWITAGSGSATRTHSEWVRNAPGHAPTAAGLLLTGTNVGTVIPTSTSAWTRIVGVYNSAATPVHEHMGVGTNSTGTSFDLTQTGGWDLWGDQQVTGILSDVPLVSGSTGAEVLQLNSAQLGRVLQSGNLDLQGSFWLETGVVSAPALQDSGYVFSMASASGAFSLRFDTTSGSWIFAARGSDLLTLVQPYLPIGSLISWRVWYKPSNGTAGLSIRANGAQDVTYGRATTTATAGAISTPTSLYLGSNGGASGFLPVRHVSLSTTTATTLQAEIVVLGDSIAANHGINQPTTAGFIYQGTSARDRAGIASLAVVANRIADQLSSFGSSIYNGNPLVKAIVIEVGINDINDNVGAPTVATRYQNMINTLKADNPSAKIVCSKLTPDKAYSDTVNVAIYSAWQAMNDCITGGGGLCTGAGASVITGCDAITTSASDAMNDGSGNLVSTYNGLSCDSGDHIHPVYECRSLIGTGWYNALHSLGLL